MSLERMDDLFGVTELAKKIEDEEAHRAEEKRAEVEVKESK